MNVFDLTSVNTSTGGTAAKQADPNSLGQDAFLKILVAQMKNQDPMEPMKDTEFIAQMAQFSSLEQLTNLNKTMTHFMGMQSGLAITENAHLIGKSVRWEQGANEQFESGEGVVKALTIVNGELMIELENSSRRVSIFAINHVEENTTK